MDYKNIAPKKREEMEKFFKENFNININNYNQEEIVNIIAKIDRLITIIMAKEIERNKDLNKKLNELNKEINTLLNNE